MADQGAFRMVLWGLWGVILILQGVAGQLQDIDVFGLHTDEAPSSMTHTWIQHEFDFEDSTTEITVCFNFQLHFTYGAMATIMSLQRQQGFIALKVVVITKEEVQDRKYGLLLGKMHVETDETLKAWQWNHVCILYSTSPEVVLNGQPTSLSVTGRTMPLNLGGAFNMTLGLPSGYYDDSHTSFGGYLTMPRVYDRRLSRREMESLAHCNSIPEGDKGLETWDVLAGEHSKIGSIAHSEDSTVYTTNGQSASVSRSFVTTKMSGSDVCPPHPTQRYIVVAGKNDYEAAVNYCKAYGGKTPSTSDPLLLDAVRQVLDRQPQLSLTFWSEGESQDKCKMITFKYGWDSYADHYEDCQSEAMYLVCKGQSTTSLKLRFNELEGDEEDLYYLVPDGVEPRFLSLLGNKIDRVGANTLGLFDKQNTMVATARTHFAQPIGRHEWGYINSNMTKTMTLTNCEEEEYTCDDGWCKLLSQRCDGTSDCRDASDESCILLQPLPETYRANRPHKPRTALQLSAKLLRIHDVDVDNNVMDACIMLITEWEDDRITFSQLSHNPSDNTIEGNNIWSPQYRLQNAEFLDAMAYVNRESVDVNIRVHRDGDGVPNVVHGVEGYMYTTGANAFLERMEGFKAGYICDFQLAVYPFDVHECHMKIGIFHTGEFKAFYNISNLHINSEASVLNLYTSSHMCYDYTMDDEGLVTSITFKILLTRRYGSYVFTTFMPCIILSVIGSCTQFFGYTNFSDRIMVTLSCLIVVAALFSQVAVTAPASAVPKAIDIFFFYSTIRLFITFLHHSMLFFAQIYVKGKEEKRNRDTMNMIRPVTAFAKEEEAARDPAPATYAKPPKIYLPVTPWLESQLKQKDSSGLQSEFAFDRVFNVISIIFGYLLDLICGLVFFLWVSNTRNEMAERFKDC